MHACTADLLAALQKVIPDLEEKRVQTNISDLSHLNHCSYTQPHWVGRLYGSPLATLRICGEDQGLGQSPLPSPPGGPAEQPRVGPRLGSGCGAHRAWGQGWVCVTRAKPEWSVPQQHRQGNKQACQSPNACAAGDAHDPRPQTRRRTQKRRPITAWQTPTEHAPHTHAPR